MTLLKLARKHKAMAELKMHPLIRRKMQKRYPSMAMGYLHYYAIYRRTDPVDDKDNIVEQFIQMMQCRKPRKMISQSYVDEFIRRVDKLIGHHREFK